MNCNVPGLRGSRQWHVWSTQWVTDIAHGIRLVMLISIFPDNMLQSVVRISCFMLQNQCMSDVLSFISESLVRWIIMCYSRLVSKGSSGCWDAQWRIQPARLNGYYEIPPYFTQKYRELYDDWCRKHDQLCYLSVKWSTIWLFRIPPQSKILPLSV